MSGYCNVCQKIVARFRRHLLKTCITLHERNPFIKRLIELDKVAVTKAEKDHLSYEIAQLKLAWSQDAINSVKKPCEYGCGRKVSPTYKGRHNKRCLGYAKMINSINKEYAVVMKPHIKTFLETRQKDFLYSYIISDTALLSYMDRYYAPHFTESQEKNFWRLVRLLAGLAVNINKENDTALDYEGILQIIRTDDLIAHAKRCDQVKKDKRKLGTALAKLLANEKLRTVERLLTAKESHERSMLSKYKCIVDLKHADFMKNWSLKVNNEDLKHQREIQLGKFKDIPTNDLKTAQLDAVCEALKKAVKKYKKMGPNEHLFGYIQKIVLVYIVVDSSRRGHETSVMTTRNYLRAKEMAMKVSQENPTGHNDFWTMKLIGK